MREDVQERSSKRGERGTQRLGDLLPVVLSAAVRPGREERQQGEIVDVTLVFPLPTSDNESKTNIVKVIRSILRENFRRHIKCELPLEKACKDRLVPLKNRVPVSAKLGENSAGLGFIQEHVPHLPARVHALLTEQQAITL